MTRADKFLTAAILLLALFGMAKTYQHLFTPSAGLLPLHATISVQGKVVQIVDLARGGRKRTFSLSGRTGPVTVEMDGARIRILSASCPEQICIKQGWIEHPGASIVCVPGEIVIHIDGQATVDAITR